MTEELVPIEDDTIYNIVRKGYGDYQRFVNNGQFIPGLDGLKKVYRRYLIAVNTVAKGSFQKSALVVGWAMGHLHPFGDQPEVLNTLVRWGLVEGQGNFGNTALYYPTAAAAMRYTEVKSNPITNEVLFRFLDYTKFTEGELGNSEPEFLIVPVSLALLYGVRGLGIGGTYSKIPAFTYDSLLDAYKANDPTLLKSAFGLEILYDRSNLQGLWNKGVGRLVLKFKVERGPNGEVILSGNATPGRPKIDQLIKWEEEGLIRIMDEGKHDMKLIFQRIKGIRRISDEMVYREVEKASVIDDLRANYIIMFSHKGSVARTGIRNWLDMTMNLYKKTFYKWQDSTISELNWKKSLVELIPIVVKGLQANKTTAAIAKETGRTKKDISYLESKPLRYLRRLDLDEEIRKYDAQIKEIQDTKVDDLIESGRKLDDFLGKWYMES